MILCNKKYFMNDAEQQIYRAKIRQALGCGAEATTKKKDSSGRNKNEEKSRWGRIARRIQKRCVIQLI